MVMFKGDISEVRDYGYTAKVKKIKHWYLVEKGLSLYTTVECPQLFLRKSDQSGLGTSNARCLCSADIGDW